MLPCDMRDISAKTDSMASMYEMIMDLPLFKGVSKDQISLFLEKTHIDFKNYGVGEILASMGDPVSMVRFVISGDISLIHPLEEVGITIEERSGFGKVLGADRLFGMATGYPYNAVAKTKTSIMEFSKAQYVNLLHSDSIYMLNFFNYLSLRAQRPVDSEIKYCHGDIMSRMCLLISIMTEPAAGEIVIRGDAKALGDYCCCDEATVNAWKTMLVKEGLGECDSNYVMINSRRDFLDYNKKMSKKN